MVDWPVLELKQKILNRYFCLLILNSLVHAVVYRPNHLSIMLDCKI